MPYIFLQERIKKIKTEYGKVQLGNITVDMVKEVPDFLLYIFSNTHAKVNDHIMIYYLVFNNCTCLISVFVV